LNKNLAKAWQQEFYDEIIASLGYSYEDDTNSRDQLSALLRSNSQARESLGRFRSKVFHGTAFAIASGPSLTRDLYEIAWILRKKTVAVIAADGAGDALAKLGILPHAIVSDLDSCSDSMLISQSKERLLFVHAHGDNITRIRELTPLFGTHVVGTTQVDPSPRVTNYGGFTDGDRACYIATAFHPNEIVLAGMDLSENYSSQHREGKQNRKPTSKKLDLGRQSLEFLIERAKEIEFVNATGEGATIKGAQHLSYKELNERFSQHA
jgi:2-amino-4-hydroxy-6-hydroxymethyldihydropteridine diphosphokinase